MIIPEKLYAGDSVCVVSPARSLSAISSQNREIADSRFAELGLELLFSKHAKEADGFMSSAISSRIEDIHEAFADKKVKMIITTIGGFNSNQLLPYLDYELIRNNPKIFCGYSDITALNNAIYTKTGLVTYSGLHYSDFGEKLYFEHSLEYFKKCLMQDEPYIILPSEKWSKDSWYRDQETRNLIKNDGYRVINEGIAEGTIIGANQRTFHYLAGTEFLPSFEDTILFIEEDHMEDIYHFDSHLTALSQQHGFEGVKGVVIGRFEPKSEVNFDDLCTVIKNNEKLKKIPVIYGLDFGHTNPRITFPIGGSAKISAVGDKVSITIIKH